MSLFIDPATGSGDFLRPFLRLGIPAILKHRHVADFTFYGNGPVGRVHVGIERKRISEITGTIAGDKRFVGRQLPKLLKAHPEFPILIVEGVVKPDFDGTLLKGKMIDRHRQRKPPMIVFYDDRFDRTTYERYQKFLATVRFKARLIVVPTADEVETAHLVAAWYRWFEKSWDSHKSVYRVEEQPVDYAILDERTWRRKTFAQWPGVGWKRSARVSRYFTSISEAANADVKTWMAALGVKEGRILATNLVKVLRGTKGESDAEAKG